MTHHNIIELLLKDLKDEHAAIIQYVTHAYAMGEGDLACSIQSVAREEMRHFDWLAETIVSLGGKPSIDRGEMRTGGATVPEWMRNDVLSEKDAIAQYEEHIREIDDPKIKRLLERILSDEKAHHDKFVKYVGKAEKEGAKDVRGARKDDVTKVLDWGIEHEYTVVLQYLIHSYMAKNENVRREMEDQAVNEMQHIGWLAEKLVDGGGTPTIEHGDIFRSADMAENLRKDIEVEREVAAAYDKAASQIDDPGLKQLLIRIRDHEIYHDRVFGDLLAQEEKK